MRIAPQRLPLASEEPVLVLAVARLAITTLALLSVAVLQFSYDGRSAAALLVIALPWSAFNVALARHSRGAALHPAVALGDLAVLAAVEAIVPETYGAVRFLALALLAVHAHLQGERIGVTAAALAALVLVVPTQVASAEWLDRDLLVFYDTVFVGAALMTVALVGRFRTEESASRMQSNEIARRRSSDEHHVRRRVADSLHDGPVQELIALGMVLSAAERAVPDEGGSELRELLGEAREMTERNVGALRDEMLQLGPYAYKELSFEAAIERCVGLWERRFGMAVRLDVERLDLPPETEEILFRVVQEAVSNAARHGAASAATVTLSSHGDEFELSVADNGRGLGDVDPLAADEPGHIGLASIRERAEWIRGELRLEDRGEGLTLTVRAPLVG